MIAPGVLPVGRKSPGEGECDGYARVVNLRVVNLPLKDLPLKDLPLKGNTRS